MGDDNAVEARAELVTFSCKEAVVYGVAPPSTTVGHRAESWNVDRPLQDVTCRVITSGDNCWVRLLDPQTGDLFAECPIATDKPLTACVEPVVDSSRYFVLRVVDRASKRHAFIGFGFRERAHASDLTAALSDYQGYLRRAREAASMQQAFAAAEAGQEGPDVPSLDFSLKPGETFSLNLAAKAPAARGSFLSDRLAALGQPPQEASAPSSSTGGSFSASSPLLPPPPSARSRPIMRALSGSQGTAAASDMQSGQQQSAASEREAAGSGAGRAPLEDSAGMPGNEGIQSRVDNGGCNGNKHGTHIGGDVDEDDDFGGFVQ